MDEQQIKERALEWANSCIQDWAGDLMAVMEVYGDLTEEEAEAVARLATDAHATFD